MSQNLWIKIGERRDGRPVYLIRGGAGDDPPAYELPADLSLLNDAELDEQHARCMGEFNRVAADTSVTAEKLTYARALKADLDTIEAEQTGRKAKAAEAAARVAQDQSAEMARLREGVNGPEGTATESGTVVESVDEAGLVAAAAEGTTRAIMTLVSEKDRKRFFGDVQITDRPQAPLSAAQQFQPKRFLQTAARAEVRASVNIPDRPAGSTLESVGDLAACYTSVAKGMSITADGRRTGPTIASIKRTFDHTVDERSNPAQVQELVDHIVSDENKEAVLAGGGWCAPSEIRYDFFNIACADGLVDLPTIGISRGGIQYPTSPSLADAVFDVGSTGTANKNLAGFGANFDYLSEPFLWTETTDIATVTGTPNKPVVRVPCPSFGTTRLECYGVILTAGNLTDDAYPEATSNTLKLLAAAHDHVVNSRYIQLMVNASSSAITLSGSGNRPVFNQVLSGLAMAAVDYREKFGMCGDDILEAVLPRWVIPWIAADLAYRVNVELLNTVAADVIGYFRARNVRVQFVGDWQVRASGLPGNPAALPGGALTAWPTTVSAMVYAAGTFVRGNGLSLDLGVIRDSVLNADNDFTAAFTEDCHLIAKLGHESRLYTIGAVVNGTGVSPLALGAYI